MSHEDEEMDKFRAMVNRHIHQNRYSAGKSCPKKPFKHLDMILDMQARARSSGREFLEDVLRLIAVYWKYGSNNTVRILSDFDGTSELRQRLIDMINVYDIMDEVFYYQPNPTLERIAEAFPHISLVVAGEINANPAMGLKLKVTDKDLGQRVHYLFKLSCFPGMIHIGSRVKAQACLLLFNLCYSKALYNTYSSDKSIVSAFMHSCRFSTDIMEQSLVLLVSRLKFTEYIEGIAPSAELLHRVWTSVIGELEVPLIDVTAVTPFHERVLRSQPMYLVTWKRLLNEK